MSLHVGYRTSTDGILSDGTAGDAVDGAGGGDYDSCCCTETPPATRKYALLQPLRESHLIQAAFVPSRGILRISRYRTAKLVGLRSQPIGPFGPIGLEKPICDGPVLPTLGNQISPAVRTHMMRYGCRKFIGSIRPISALSVKRN